MAIAAFFEHCASYPHAFQGDRQGLFNPSIYATTIDSPGVSDVIAALGYHIMSVGEHHACRALWTASRKKYGSALMSARASIQHPDLARSDEMLLAVMLLAAYEVSHHTTACMVSLTVHRRWCLTRTTRSNLWRHTSMALLSCFAFAVQSSFAIRQSFNCSHTFVAKR